MAMQKVYNRINWENYPILDTPLNEQNLNKIDYATDELDNRVITHENVKATKEEVAPLIRNIEFNEKTGIFTITRKDGSSFIIDTLLEKIQTNWDYDPQTQKLILTMEDGTTQEIDLSELITEFEFVDTATIDFSVDNSGKVSAIVKEGSIEEKHLRPNYLADIKVESAKAEAARAAAEVSEANAKKSENAAAKSASDSAGSASDSADSASASAASAAAALASQNAAKASETAAKNSQTAAKTSETNAKESETAAKTSETNAGNSAKAAAGSATAAATSAAESAESAENAAASETNAAKSASAAATSEKNAKTSETNATTQATAAKNSATSAATSASTATTKAGEAATSASNAASSADTATRQATSASSSASTATTQANNAKTSATNAATSATKAQSYAEGGTGTRTGEDTDNAKYYYEQSKSISESFSGALRPMGTVAFANLPTLSSVVGGNMYNISDGFTTTAQFKEGAGHPYPAGTNVYKTADGYWDCLAGTPVNTVNGKRGDVTITKADVGLGNVDNTADANKNVNSAKTATTATTATTANKVANALKFTGGSNVTYDGSTAQTVAIPTSLPANGGNASTVGGVPIAGKDIDANFSTAYRTQTKGNTTQGDYISTLRNNVASVPNSPQYGSGLAFGRGDTHGYLYTSYGTEALAYIGGGNGNKLNWVKRIAFTDSIPTVNNGTLTIQRNGSTVATFTANSSANVTANITDNDTDTKVTQTAVTDSANYPLLLAPKGQTTNQTTTACFDSGVTLNPNNNTITANISGKANTAGTADTANKVKAALTFTGGVSKTYDGSTAQSVAIPTVVNVLTSTSTTDALSAAQGKALNDNKLEKTGKAVSASTSDVALALTSGIDHGHIMNFNLIGKTNQPDFLWGGMNNDLHNQYVYYTSQLNVNKAASADVANKLAKTVTIYGNTFAGEGDVGGQGHFYGPMPESFGNLYAKNSIELRENLMSDNTYMDNIGFAPGIGFHWSNVCGASLKMGSDQKLHYIIATGVEEAVHGNIVANLESTYVVAGSYTIGGAGSTINEIRSSTGVHLIANSGLNNVYLSGAQIIACANSEDVNNSLRPVFASSFNTSSSRDVKENLKEITDGDAEKLLQIPTYHFDYINGDKDQVGCIAEDIEIFYPEICGYQIDEKTGEKKLFGLDYSKFVPYIIKQLQVQNKKIEELQAKIDELEGTINKP